jgi:hypothetical protein
MHACMHAPPVIVHWHNTGFDTYTTGVENVGIMCDGGKDSQRYVHHLHNIAALPCWNHTYFRWLVLDDLREHGWLIRNEYYNALANLCDCMCHYLNHYHRGGDCLYKFYIILRYYYHHALYHYSYNIIHNTPILMETTQYPTFSGWKVIGIWRELSFSLSFDYTSCLLRTAHDLELITDW